MPHKTIWKDLTLRMLGHPSLIRRIQAPVILKKLDLKGDETVLDAGCGEGSFTFEMAKRCKVSVGIDLKLKKELSLVLNKQPRVSYAKGDAQKLPFASKKFDKILLSSVLQMVEDDKTVLKECNRVLKAKGTLVLSVPIEYCCIKKLNRFKFQLKEKFESRGKAYYDLQEIMGLLRNEDFESVDIEFTPKKWGSFIFEIGLYLWFQCNFPFFSCTLFPVLYPIAYFDKFANVSQTGNEVVIKARKTQDE